MEAKLSKNFDISKCKVPLEVLKELFVSKKLHLLRTYLFITRHPAFSGHLKKKDISKLANMLGVHSITVRRHIKSLSELGLVQIFSSVIMACGSAQFAATSGKKRVFLIDFNENITELAVVALMAEQYLRLRKGKTVDSGDRFQISASYTERYLRKLGRDSHRTYISRKRNSARQKGMVMYSTIRKEYDCSPERLPDVVGQVMECSRNMKSREKLFLSRRTNRVVSEEPATIDFMPYIVKRGMSNKYRSIASLVLSKR